MMLRRTSLHSFIHPSCTHLLLFKYSQYSTSPADYILSDAPPSPSTKYQSPHISPSKQGSLEATYARKNIKVNTDKVDWKCPSCNSHNFARRDVCFVCKAPKGKDAIVDPKQLERRVEQKRNNMLQHRMKIIEQKKSFNGDQWNNQNDFNNNANHSNNNNNTNTLNNFNNTPKDLHSSEVGKVIRSMRERKDTITNDSYAPQF